MGVLHPAVIWTVHLKLRRAVVGYVLRSAVFRAAALVTLELRQKFSVGDTLAEPLALLFVGAFAGSVLITVRSRWRSVQAVGAS